MLHIKDVILQNGSFLLSLDLPPLGTGIYAMIGPSGGGKSTALAAIAGFQPLCAGQILWKDKDISKTLPAKRPVAILFQDNNLFPHLSIERNVALALSHRNSLTQNEKTKVSKALARVGLKAYGAKKLLNFPVGNKAAQHWRVFCCRISQFCCSTNPFQHWGPR